MHGSMTLTDVRWYVLLADSSAERKACNWLERRQFLPYWPKYTGQVKLNRHRRKARLRSVLPGYLFLPLPTCRDPDWRLILKTPGVREVIRDVDSVPVSIRDTEIEHIRTIEAALNSSPLCAAEGIPFMVGQSVRLIDVTHPLFQLQGPIVRIDKGGQIIVEVEMFGRRTRATLPVSEIEAM